MIGRELEQCPLEDMLAQSREAWHRALGEHGTSGFVVCLSTLLDGDDVLFDCRFQSAIKGLFGYENGEFAGIGGFDFEFHHESTNHGMSVPIGAESGLSMELSSAGD